MFKVNHKDTKLTSVAFSSVSIVDFEQVHVSRVQWIDYDDLFKDLMFILHWFTRFFKFVVYFIRAYFM